MRLTGFGGRELACDFSPLTPLTTMTFPRFGLLVVLSFLTASVVHAQDGAVNESKREIPVAYDVDVVVVGGSTGAVAAAEAAAKAGAKVFLAAPRPYLGDDMCATMRLFMEKDEKPLNALGAAVFDPKGALAKAQLPSHPFEYVSNIAPSPKHDDSKKKPILSDTTVGGNTSDCVQYDADVLITADAGSVKPIQDVKVCAFSRPEDFEPKAITVSISDDRENWKEVGTAAFPESITEETDTEPIAVVPVNGSARYVRVKVERADKSPRLLLSEIAITPPVTEEQKAAANEPWRGPVTPLHVKKTLDRALLDAGVTFLYSCYPTEILRDKKGQLAGVVMANRAGRQAVKAKVIIDATERGTVARMAGAEFAPYPAGTTQKFQRIVVGGEIKQAPGLTGSKLGLSYPALPEGHGTEFINYEIAVPMKDDSFAAFNNAEQVARSLTYSKDQPVDTEELFQVPPDPVKAVAATTGPWKGVEALPLDVFRPEGQPRLFVLGGCADVTRDDAAQLLRPTALMAAGERVGTAAAKEAKDLPTPGKVAVAGTAGKATTKGDVKELLQGLRPGEKADAVVSSPERTLPILGEYDVVVIGGGTGGAPAGIAAARQGAKTLVLEYQHGLGGVGTLGRISKYWRAYKEGFPKSTPEVNAYWDPRARSEWYRQEIVKPGGEVWYGVLGNGAVVQGNRVKGVVVTTPLGRGVVLAKEVVDSTGNSDIAAAAGAKTIMPGSGQFAIQGTGLPAIRWGGRDFFNSDFTIVDENDMVDVWQMQLYTRLKYNNVFDTGTFIDSRERRRIEGDYTQPVLDQINNRTYPDTIVLMETNFDQHTFAVDPYLEATHPGRLENLTARMPYRCFIPKDMEGILVTGLSVSVEHDALPLARIQAHIQNAGYAIGLAAATAAKEDKGVREIDIRALQKSLVELGSLPESVLTEVDSYPIAKGKLEKAVKTLPDDYKGASLLFVQPQESIPLLKTAYAETNDPQAKLIYAHTLGLLGDNTGADTLLEYLEKNPWDEGWNFRALNNFGATMSKQDSYILTLARLKDKRVLPVALKKAGELTPKSDFSHYRAVALAAESFRDPSAAPVLAKLLSAPEVAGHENTDLKVVLSDIKPSTSDNTTRANSLREIFLARALYWCGDEGGLGQKTLETYAKDLRGHWVRFATEALREKPKS